MFKPRFPSHSTVVAYVALTAALSTGGAYAAAQIGAKDIKPDAVRSKHIKDGQVRTGDLGFAAVTSEKVADSSLTGDDVNEPTLDIVPDSAALAGRGPASFATSSVYKTEAATDAGTRLGDNTNVKNMACDAGDILLSGGPASISPTSKILESFPTPGGTNSWTVRINDGGIADNFTVVILCLDQTP